MKISIFLVISFLCLQTFADVDINLSYTTENENIEIIFYNLPSIVDSIPHAADFVQSDCSLAGTIGTERNLTDNTASFDLENDKYSLCFRASGSSVYELQSAASLTVSSCENVINNPTLCNSTHNCISCLTEPSTCYLYLNAPEGDNCYNTECTPTQANECDDSNQCSVDTCFKTSTSYTCTHEPYEGSCTHSDLCFETAVCDTETMTCKGLTAVVCTDPDVCHVSTCNSTTGLCENTFTNACTDDNSCTDDTCEDVEGVWQCVFTNNDANSCTDGSMCTANHCSAGECVATQTVFCTGVACSPCQTAQACEPTTGECVYHNTSGGACDDYDPCTYNDLCVDGECRGTPIICEADDPCTEAVCTGTSTCHHVALTGAVCDDGIACTLNDTCVAGVCKGTRASDCIFNCTSTEDKCLDPELVTLVSESEEEAGSETCTSAGVYVTTHLLSVVAGGAVGAAAMFFWASGQAGARPATRTSAATAAATGPPARSAARKGTLSPREREMHRYSSQTALTSSPSPRREPQMKRGMTTSELSLPGESPRSPRSDRLSRV